jgi:hypothetical protein
MNSLLHTNIVGHQKLMHQFVDWNVVVYNWGLMSDQMYNYYKKNVDEIIMLKLKLCNPSTVNEIK